MTGQWVLEGADLAHVDRLAAYVALVLRPGDLVALEGELGAGKTTFARSLIRSFCNDDTLDIPSPTFSLVQSYECDRLPISHFDCYRLTSVDELEELGLDDALRLGAALVEWADRIMPALPGDRLVIQFEDGDSETSRTLRLTGLGSWEDRLARLQALMTFCSGTDWAEARPAFLQGDASTRAYARLSRNGGSAILMDSPAKPDGPPVKDGKPYSQLVHLAEDVKPFVAVAQALGQAGLSVPSIIGCDLEQGFLLTTDLGDRVFSKETGDDPPLEVLYAAAVDVLLHLRQHPPPEHLPLPDGEKHALPAFDRDAFLAETELLPDWFYEAVHGSPLAEPVRRAFLEEFARLYERITQRDVSWVLRDYHSPNLLWLPDRQGIERVGVIDFQDALRGSAAYDLVSLLQDARRDISPELEAHLCDHYCEARAGTDSGFDAQGFAVDYAVLGAQRNSKILGIFARLAKRDGKHDYLAHIPRVSGYLERNLAHPALRNLREWFDEHLPAEDRKAPLKI